MTNSNHKKPILPLPELVAEPLTADEWTAMQLTAALHDIMVDRIIGNGPARWGDVAELTSAIHAIQHMIQGQATSRLFPGHFRLLGEGVISEDEEEPKPEEVSPSGNA